MVSGASSTDHDHFFHLQRRHGPMEDVFSYSAPSVSWVGLQNDCFGPLHDRFLKARNAMLVALAESMSGTSTCQVGTCRMREIPTTTVDKRI